MKTFVIRLFVPAASETSARELHGVVEAVSGGRRTTFAGAEELLELLHAASEPDGELLEQTRLTTFGSEER